MLRINFFGDFKCDDVSRLAFSETLTALLRDADINALNFEAPVRVADPHPIVKSGPCLSQDPSAPAFLENNGFNLVSLANNHMADCGSAALDATVSAFSHTCGAGPWQKAYSPEILEIQGYKVAFVALVHHESGVLDESLYCKDSHGTAWMLHPCVDEIIAKAHEQCDFVFVLAHAGVEHEDMPLPELRTLYHHWIDAGADGVIASHPHVPQPWETYKGKPVFYSLGNFCFDSISAHAPEYWFRSIAACLTIDDQGTIRTEVIPCSYNPQDKTITEVSGDKDFQRHLDKINATFSDEESYARAIDELCRRHASQYEHYAKIAGYQKMTLKHCLRWIGGRMRGKDKTVNIAPLLNNFTCESHRWVIMRILSSRL